MKVVNPRNIFSILIIQYFAKNFLSKNKYVDIHGYLVAMKQRLPMQIVIYAKQNVAK